MSRFLTEKDYAFIHAVSDELINKVVDTTIKLYRIDLSDETENIYGESVDKSYLTPVILKCLINRDSPTESYDKNGISETSNALFAFKLKLFDDLGWQPSVGDIVEWNGYFYEVMTTKISQYLQNRPDYNFALILSCTSTNMSMTNVKDRDE